MPFCRIQSWHGENNRLYLNLKDIFVYVSRRKRREKEREREKQREINMLKYIFMTTKENNARATIPIDWGNNFDVCTNLRYSRLKCYGNIFLHHYLSLSCFVSGASGDNRAKMKYLFWSFNVSGLMTQTHEFQTFFIFYSKNKRRKKSFHFSNANIINWLVQSPQNRFQSFIYCWLFTKQIFSGDKSNEMKMKSKRQSLPLMLIVMVKATCDEIYRHKWKWT